MFGFIKKIFGTSHERAIRRMQPKVEAIGALEEELKKLSDAKLRGKTAEFKEQLDNGATLDDILVPAFAVCREAGRRALRMRHYDVQLIGGMVLHSGGIAEMRTGEGKTLVATLPCYLNALEGKGVHVVTVNDYLAKRDAEWMGKLYGFLGLETGVVINQQNDSDKKKAYLADITYGQNNEFGFDYLRDNMKFSALDYMQRPLHYAIVDEVDSILIDEARTPLIISGQGEGASQKYRTISDLIPKLKIDEHYTVDEKGHSVTLTDDGVDLAQQLLSKAGALKGLNLYDPQNLETLHILNQCLKAHTLYKRDVNYLVRDKKVMIVDEFTGRILVGRRWSDGLHQAVEAKEHVPVQEESRTMATITFQNLFRLYKKLSGMTGTADTEAAEFHSTYKLAVTIIPTNKTTQRVDQQDVVYKTEPEKFTAVIQEILDNHEVGIPILVGTTSVEKSGAISKLLTKKGIPHEVLNAKHHENEAFVVAQAGRKGAITVSTNMAGRGTDIILGGSAEMLAKKEFRELNKLPNGEYLPLDDINRMVAQDAEEFEKLVAKHKKECDKEGDEVRELGGLYIIGTERHESRRIDNQLRGRAGRQGDPGASKFYLSLEDDLMRIFAGDRVKNLMERMGMPDNEPIEHPWVTKSVENAQKKVEERNFDIRKNVLEYDDVMSAQRKTVYDLRQALLLGRYSPEVLDDDGKPTGEKRVVRPLAAIAEEVKPKIGELLGMHLSDPLLPLDKEGKKKALKRKDFEKLKKEAESRKAKLTISEPEDLQVAIYRGRPGFPGWGVKIDLKGREEDVLGVYDELLELVPTALTEQRERVLDLIDRILGAMVEESCPPRKPPEDWDWGGIFEGFKEHFGVDLPDEIAEHGDQELLARDLFKRAEEVYEKKEKDLGVEMMLRVFRFVYLEELDRAWVDHLTDMDHLRDGIGLRGYGQRDPKQEYKKEGYNLFVTMVARTSSNVITRALSVEVKRPEDEREREARELMRHAEELRRAMAKHAEPMPPGAAEADEPSAAQEPLIGSEMECPCGSGRPFAKCHGAEEEASV
ncbi:MAG: preprotein translocase subunit SecA [Polyangiaceae bacterium]